MHVLFLFCLYVCTSMCTWVSAPIWVYTCHCLQNSPDAILLELESVSGQYLLIMTAQLASAQEWTQLLIPSAYIAPFCWFMSDHVFLCDFWISESGPQAHYQSNQLLHCVATKLQVVFLPDDFESFKKSEIHNLAVKLTMCPHMWTSFLTFGVNS